MNISFKKTLWEKIFLPDDKKESLLNVIQNNDPESAYSIIKKKFGHDAVIQDEEILHTIETNGHPTIIIRDMDGDVIWDNNTLPKEDDYVLSIEWSTKDFESRATDLEECGIGPFDKSLFKDALHVMINEHDPLQGISWKDIDFLLFKLCQKDQS